MQIQSNANVYHHNTCIKKHRWPLWYTLHPTNLVGWSNIEYMTQGVKIAAVYIHAITWLDNLYYISTLWSALLSYSLWALCQQIARLYILVWGDLSWSYSTKLHKPNEFIEVLPMIFLASFPGPEISEQDWGTRRGCSFQRGARRQNFSTNMSSLMIMHMQHKGTAGHNVCKQIQNIICSGWKQYVHNTVTLRHTYVILLSSSTVSLLFSFRRVPNGMSQSLEEIPNPMEESVTISIRQLPESRSMLSAWIFFFTSACWCQPTLYNFTK